MSIGTISADEFIRRFLLHVLPKGFHRIRHYGLLASAGCKANIARARELIAALIPEAEPPAAHDTIDSDAGPARAVDLGEGRGAGVRKPPKNEPAGQRRGVGRLWGIGRAAALVVDGFAQIGEG